MTYVMVDVEADGPCPGLYSMIEIGAVDVSDPANTFYGKLRPINLLYVPEALAVTGYSREDTLEFDDPAEVMLSFEEWLNDINRPMFISDNNGFDWQFVNFYFWSFRNNNPFGHSSTNLGSLYKGMQKNVSANFKRMRKTPHTHNPVDDAMGNVEALLEMRDKLGLKFK